MKTTALLSLFAGAALALAATNAEKANATKEAVNAGGGATSTATTGSRPARRPRARRIKPPRKPRR